MKFNNILKNEERLDGVRLIKTVFFCTFLWGLLGHAYGFLSLNISHDSLGGFISGSGEIALYRRGTQSETVVKIANGRFLVPLLRILTQSEIVLPWTVGISSLILIGCSAFFLIKTFDLNKKWMVFLVTGIMTLNVSAISLLATYMHDAVADLLALFMTVLAAYLWKRRIESGKRRYSILAGLAIIVSLGLYQAYIAVTCTLSVIYLIMRLIDGEESINLIKNGLIAIGIVLVGGVVYLILTMLICHVSGVPLETTSDNSIVKVLDFSDGIIDRLYSCFSLVRRKILALRVTDSFTAYLHRGINLFLFLISFGTLIYFVVKEKLLTKQKTYLLCLLVILAVMYFEFNAPLIYYVLNFICVFYIYFFAIFAIYILVKKGKNVATVGLLIAFIMFLPLTMCLVVVSGGQSHDLVLYAMYLAYVIPVMLIGRMQGKYNTHYIHWYKWIAFALIFIVLLSNIQTANLIYLEKDLGRQETLFVMTKVAAEIEQQPEYVAGETQVVFIGLPIDNQEDSYCTYITGTGRAVITNYIFYEPYFEYMLQYDISICSIDEMEELASEKYIQEMPCYPEDGSVQMYNGVIVVKFSEYNAT